MVFQCAGTINTALSQDQLQQIWQSLSYISINHWDMIMMLQPATQSLKW